MSGKVKIWLARSEDTLVATDDESLRVIRRIGEGEVVAFHPVRTRSNAWHRRYWLMITRVAEQITEFNISLGSAPAMMPIKSPYDLHTAVKLATGHCTTQHIKGTPYVLRIPMPTDFESMDADSWAEFYPRVLDAIHEHALPQVRIPEVQEELARLAS